MPRRIPTTRRHAWIAAACVAALQLANAGTSFGQPDASSVYKRPRAAVAARAPAADVTQTKRILAALPERIESVIVTGPLGARRKALGLGQPKPTAPPPNQPVRMAPPYAYPVPPAAAAPAASAIPPPTTLEETLLNFNSFLFAFVPKLYEQIDPATVSGTVFAAGQFKSQGIPGGTIFDGAQVMLLSQDLPAGVQSIIASGRLRSGALPVLATEANEEWRQGRLIVYLAAPDRRTLIAASSKTFLDELLVNLGPNAPQTRRFPTLTQIPDGPVNVWGLCRPIISSARDQAAEQNAKDTTTPKNRYISFSLNNAVPECVIRNVLTKPASEAEQQEVSAAIAKMGRNQSARWLDAENYEWTIPEPEGEFALFLLAIMGHTIYV